MDTLLERIVIQHGPGPLDGLSVVSQGLVAGAQGAQSGNIQTAEPISLEEYPVVKLVGVGNSKSLQKLAPVQRDRLFESIETVG